ncbi:MAG: crossover junction endodeoxyribonuclease RuvC [Ignavibacteria bacterium]|jgi:crossover junction endodeoxyribonuclease RuvC
MVILGIDPGSVITGIGIIHCNGDKIKLVELDAVVLKPKDALTKRLKIIYDACLEKINKYKPDELAIETAFFGKNIQSTLKLGQARGVAIIAAVNSNINVSEYSPREVKKSITGSGAASKEQVKFMVKRILDIKEDPAYLDSSDALAVALCHHYNFKNLIAKSGKKNNNWKKFVEANPERIIKK